MKETFQFKSQNIMQHGQAVHDTYLKIIQALDTNALDKYEFPDIIKDNWNTLKEILYPLDIMRKYHIYHDCGKPWCRTVDEKGKQHFPGHADKSAQIFKDTFPTEKQDNQIVAELIKWDMIFHSGADEEIKDFCRSKKLKFRWSLWLTSFAEVYSNREMFLDSPSGEKNFKMKHQRLCDVLTFVLL